MCTRYVYQCWHNAYITSLVLATGSVHVLTIYDNAIICGTLEGRKLGCSHDNIQVITDHAHNLLCIYNSKSRVENSLQVKTIYMHAAKHHKYPFKKHHFVLTDNASSNL